VVGGGEVTSLTATKNIKRDKLLGCKMCIYILQILSICIIIISGERRSVMSVNGVLHFGKLLQPCKEFEVHRILSYSNFVLNFISKWKWKN